MYLSRKVVCGPKTDWGWSRRRWLSHFLHAWTCSNSPTCPRSVFLHAWTCSNLPRANVPATSCLCIVEVCGMWCVDLDRKWITKNSCIDRYNRNPTSFRAPWNYIPMQHMSVYLNHDDADNHLSAGYSASASTDNSTDNRLVCSHLICTIVYMLLKMLKQIDTCVSSPFGEQGVLSSIVRIHV